MSQDQPFQPPNFPNYRVETEDDLVPASGQPRKPPTTAELFEQLEQVRELVHAASQPLTALLTLLELLQAHQDQLPTLDNGDQQDLGVIVEQATLLKEVIRKLQALLD